MVMGIAFGSLGHRRLHTYDGGVLIHVESFATIR